MFTEWSEHDLLRFHRRKKVERDLTINKQGLNPLLTLLDQTASCTTQTLWVLIRTAHFTLHVLLDIFTISHPFPFIRQKRTLYEAYSTIVTHPKQMSWKTRPRGSEKGAGQSAPLILDLLLNFSLDPFLSFHNPGPEPFDRPRTWGGNRELLNYAIWFCLKSGIQKTAFTFPHWEIGSEKKHSAKGPFGWDLANVPDHSLSWITLSGT